MTIDLTLIPNPEGTFTAAGATIRADGRISEGRDQVLPRLYFSVATPDNLPSVGVSDGSIAIAASDGFFNEQIYIWNDTNTDEGPPLFKWRLAAATNDKNQGLDFRQQVIGINSVTNISDLVPRSGILKEITIEVIQPYDNNASMIIQNADSFVFVEESKIDLTLPGTYRVLFYANDESFDACGSNQLQTIISGNPSTGSSLIYIKFTDDTVGSSLVFEPLRFGPDGTRVVPNITPTGNKILDDFPGASFAFSVRKLRDAYTGSALRVRRSNDNSELDIGFDANGNLDVTSLTNFVGPNDGFVSIWYDQSSNNRNATTTSLSEQPPIVLSGSIIEEKGLPAVSGGSGVTMDTGFTGLGTKTVLSVANTISPVGSSITRILTSYSGSGAIAPNTVLDSFGGLRYVDGDTSVTIPGYTKGRHLHYARNNTTSLVLGFDKSTLVVQTGASATTNTLSYKLFEEGGANVDEYPTNIQEIIVYPTDQDVNRSGLEANMFAYFFSLESQGWNNKVQISLSDPSITVAQMDETVLPTEILDSDNANSAQPRGGDIRISSDEFGDMLLPHTVEYFKTTPGAIGAKASIWVKPEGNSSVWVWYNNPNATHLPENDTFGAYNIWTNAELFMPCAPDRASQDLGPLHNHGKPGIIQDYETITIFDGTSEYAAWPSIIKRTIDGNLICAFRRGGANEGIDINGYLSIHLSTNNGLSWTELSTINQADGTADTRNPDLIQLSSGDIWCVYTKRTPVISEVFYRVSNDGGATWGSELSVVAVGGLDDSKGKPTELLNGNVGLAVFNPGTNAVTYYEWNGSSWGSVGSIATGFNETSIVQDPNTPTTLYAFLRSTSSNGVWRSVSTDGGVNWIAPLQITSTNSQSPIEAQYLENGDLLTAVAEDRANGVCSVFRSVDNGLTFEADEARIAQESTAVAGLNGEGFYPSFVEIETNVFGAVFYHDTDTQTQPTKILFRIFRIEAGGSLVSYTGAGTPIRGILFDGVDNFIGEIGDVDSFRYVHETGTFTFRGVVQLEDFSADDVGAFLGNVASSSDLGFFITYDNRSSISATREIRVFLTNGSGTPIIDARISSALNDNNQHLIHISGNNLDQTVRVYIDGVLVGSQSGYNALGTGSSTRTLNIGRQNHSTPTSHLNGSLKHVALYDFAFTPSQVSQEHENWSNMVSFWSSSPVLTGGEAWTLWDGPSATDPVLSPGDTFSTGLVQMDKSDDLFEVDTNIVMKPSFNINKTQTSGSDFYFWSVTDSFVTFLGLGSPASVSGRGSDYSEAYRGTVDLISSGPIAKIAITASLGLPLGTEDLSSSVELQSIDVTSRTFTLLDSFDLSTTTIGTNNKLSRSASSFGCTYLGNNRLLAIHGGDYKFTQGGVTFSSTTDVVADATTDNINIQVVKDGLPIADELVTFNTGLTLQDLIDSINTNISLSSANIIASAEPVTGGVQLRITWNDPSNISLSSTGVTISEGTIETNPIVPKLFGSGILSGFNDVIFALTGTKIFWAFLFDTTGDTLTLLDSTEIFSPVDVPYNTFEEGILSQDEKTFDWVVRRAGPIPTNCAVLALAQDSTKNNNELGLAVGIDVSGDTITSSSPIVFSDTPLGVDDPFSMIPSFSGNRTIVSTTGRESNDELQAHVIEVSSGTGALTFASITLNNIQRTDGVMGLTSLGDDFYMIISETINEVSVLSGEPILNGEGWSLLFGDSRIANTVGELTAGSFVGENAFTIGDGEYREWDGAAWTVISNYPSDSNFDVQRGRIISITPTSGTSITDEANIIVRSDKVPYLDQKAGSDADSSIILLQSGNLFFVTDGDQRRWPNGLVSNHVL